MNELSSGALPLQSRANQREMVITVADCVILEHELTGDRRVLIERRRRSIAASFVTPSNSFA
jgi:hypothetical protein